MQEEVTMTRTMSIVRASLIAFAILFLVASWLGMYAAIVGLVGAIEEYGLLDIRVLLDAELAYPGMGAFFAASIAVVLAVKVNRIAAFSLFRLIKKNFFVSLLFCVPILVSPVFFLIGPK